MPLEEDTHTHTHTNARTKAISRNQARAAVPGLKMALILGKTEVKADFTTRWVGKYVPAMLDYTRKCQKIITDVLSKQGLQSE